MNKLRCYLNYFERISSGYPDLDKKISILRLCIENNDLPDYDNLKIKMSKVEILDSGTIEEIDKNVIQADFANKFVGGGVLKKGCVQEEIRFCISPELTVSLLFLEKLLDNEISYIIGSERFSAFKGYGRDFAFANDFVDSSLDFFFLFLL